MAQRLVDLYAVGERVEILLTIDEVDVWRAGRVAGHQFPAVWVVTDADRRMWFVTNGKRIRPSAARSVAQPGS
jgi:hypothetical protein